MRWDLPGEAQAAAVFDDSVTRAAGANIEVARLRFVDADLLCGDDDSARLACFDKDAATDNRRSDNSAAREVEHADGGCGTLTQKRYEY